MTVRLSAVTDTPPTDLVLAPTGAPASSAAESATGETTAVPELRPSGVVTAKTAEPARPLRAADQLCGALKPKGRSAEPRARVARAGVEASAAGAGAGDACE